MQQKLDFTAHPPAAAAGGAGDDDAEQAVFTDVAVGQQLQLRQQEGGSGWVCARADGSSVCDVPTEAAASLSQASRQQQQQQQQQQRPGGSPRAVIRSVKRAQHDPSAAVSIQVRVTFPPPDQPPPLQQAPAPADDPAGFTLTTHELEQLAYDSDIRATLQDKRLQAALLQVDGAPNREEALKVALDNPAFRQFADTMLCVMGKADADGVGGASQAAVQLVKPGVQDPTAGL